MKRVPLEEARVQLDTLLADAAGGQRILITRNGEDVGLLTSARFDRMGPSLLEIEPASVGRVLKPLTDEDDLLGEMAQP